MTRKVQLLVQLGGQAGASRPSSAKTVKIMFSPRSNTKNHVLSAALVPVSRVVMVAAATCGSVAIIAAALAAIYAWHRLWRPVPVVAWAANMCKCPQRGDAACSGGTPTSLKMLENGVLQVTHGFASQ